MSGTIRYTCNKKNEPTMRVDCSSCPEYNPCGKEGKWCFVGALIKEAANTKKCTDAAMLSAEGNLYPVMRDMSTVTIHIGSNQEIDILREDIKKALKNATIGFDLGVSKFESSND